MRENNPSTSIQPELTVIRVGRHSLSFSIANEQDEEHPLIFEPYPVKKGISMAANLREAFKSDSPLLQSKQRALVMTDAPTLMVPRDLYHQEEAETLYFHAFTKQEGMAVLPNQINELNAVALFMVNRDLCNVLSDHYSQLHYCSVMVPVWKYLYQRSFVGKRNKLYGYFHDGCLDVCSFKQNRFLFCNSFDSTPSGTGSANAHDALFFLLSVWKQLALKVDYDELHLVGDIPERDWLINELRQYLQRAYVINPASDFNRDPITRMEGLSFDLVTLWARNKRTN